MKITIISLGKFDNSFFKKIFDDYLKRIRGVALKEIDFKKSKNMPVDMVKKKEAELIEKNLAKNSIIIALDENGKEYKSVDFSKLLDKYNLNGESNIDFIIGGAFGLDALIIKKAHRVISLSQMTLPHMMARIILIEQIYRAHLISSGHPYHKE